MVPRQASIHDATNVVYSPYVEFGGCIRVLRRWSRVVGLPKDIPGSGAIFGDSMPVDGAGVNNVPPLNSASNRRLLDMDAHPRVR